MPDDTDNIPAETPAAAREPRPVPVYPLSGFDTVEATENHRSKLRLVIVSILGILLLVGIFFGAIWALDHFGQGQKGTSEGEPTATPVAEIPPTRGRGVSIEGWGEILGFQGDTKAKWIAMDEAMSAKAYRGFHIPEKAIEAAFLAETKAGKPDLYVYRTPKKLPSWWNTNWDHKTPKIFLDNFVGGDEFLVMELDTLLKHGVTLDEIEQDALVKHNGVACVILVRRDCANQVWPAEGEPCDAKFVAQVCPKDKVKEKSVDEPCPSRNTDPGGLYTPHHPGTKTYYHPSAPKNAKAPDHKRGSTEKVEENRGKGEGKTGAVGNGGNPEPEPPAVSPATGDEVTGELDEVN